MASVVFPGSARTPRLAKVKYKCRTRGLSLHPLLHSRLRNATNSWKVSPSASATTCRV